MEPESDRGLIDRRRFYKPPDSGVPARPHAGGNAGIGEASAYSAVTEGDSAFERKPGNIVVVEAATAGVGASTLSALLARELTERGLKCVLVDADLHGGGLDVLLGAENEDGSRFGEISAPLGKIDGKALLRELPTWDGIPLLACDPWKTENPQSWEVRACVKALARVRSAIIVDVGQWHHLPNIPELEQGIRIVAVELTVLGLARAKTSIQTRRAHAERHDTAENREIVIGMVPRGTVREHGVTSLDEAEEYLGCEISAIVKPDAKLCSELLEGLGLRKPNRATAKAIAVLADRVQELIGMRQVYHGTRAP